MNIPIAERRQIENEMIFRRMNEKVGDDLGALDAMNIEKGDIYLIRDDDVLLRFKCECSDEDCEERVSLKLSEYQSIHEDRDTFIVAPGHQVEAIESVIKTETNYSVVRKNHSTPEPNNELKTTQTNTATD